MDLEKVLLSSMVIKFRGSQFMNDCSYLLMVRFEVDILQIANQK